MMKRIELVIYFVFFSMLNSIGQTPVSWLLQRDTMNFDDGIFLHAETSADWASNVLNNEWLYDMTIGGHIGENQERALISAMDDVNRVGGNMRGDISFYNFKDSVFNQGNWGIQANVGMVYNMYAGFSKNAFELIFSGNHQFLGDTMKLGPSTFDYQAFKKFGVGVFNKKTLSGFRLNVVMGQDFQHLDLRKANLYTSPTGNQVELTYNGEFWQADTSKTGFVANKGLGLSLDGDYNLPFKNGSGFISFSVRNLGWVKWSELTNHFAVDSTFTWTGIELNNIDSLSSNYGLPNWSDTLGVERSQSSHWRALPTFIHLRVLKKWNEKNSYFAGINLQPNFVSIPQVYFGLSQFVGPGLLISEQLAYGGYGGFRFGLETQYFIKNNVYFRAGVPDVLGTFASFNKGSGGFLGVGIHFN